MNQYRWRCGPNNGIDREQESAAPFARAPSWDVRHHLPMAFDYSHDIKSAPAAVQASWFSAPLFLALCFRTWALRFSFSSERPIENAWRY